MRFAVAVAALTGVRDMNDMNDKQRRRVVQ